MRLRPLAILSLAVLALTGCSPIPGSTVSVPPSAAPSTSTPQPTGGTEGDVLPTAPLEAGAAAAEAAVRVVQTFGQPELTPEAWMEAMYPVLSTKGATAYLHTDPANIPVTAVVGEPAVLTGLTATYAIVDVPTDAGLYTVTLTRDDEDSPWLAERIRPKQS
ncbi:hypothetical protein IWX78_003201 [Mycetocola sp. CAN_C7]|uniref:hypothetical protein n=1 Tax=Mycetocola sp. CAN_C7 TaxID=2787724 RepID=UPI0018CADA1E